MFVSRGLHFLAVQTDEEADQCDGLWLLQDKELPSIWEKTAKMMAFSESHNKAYSIRATRSKSRRWLHKCWNWAWELAMFWQYATCKLCSDLGSRCEEAYMYNYLVARDIHCTTLKNFLAVGSMHAYLTYFGKVDIRKIRTWAHEDCIVPRGTVVKKKIWYDSV